ncbi:hypothetical protein BVRB_017770 [Beta vulgaris subsp. vulgaris]|uniref:Uncharacterized protein n=1 Tax=Beta vulgaris subsp. vulgaris TaxID=3555 RepID=A0A0J7YM27_BETVV|nr:hypothetical protein BVRB_017770 [Beta vulgaris subsp. vulgaris]
MILVRNSCHKPNIDMAGGDSQWYSMRNAAGNLIRFALPQRSTPIYFAVAADDGVSVKALIQAGEKAQEPNAAGLWPHDYATPKCEAELPPVDKEKASKVEANRIAKLTSKGGAKKKAKK